MHSNCCCSCSFKPEILKIGQLSHKMHPNNILDSQESTTILNARTKKCGNLLNAPRISHVEAYQRLKKLYLMPPCLTLSIIRYVSRVKQLDDDDDDDIQRYLIGPLSSG